jgi:hypothetical protein
MFHDLMDSMLSGAGSGSDQEGPDADQLADLLGGLLEGSAGQQGGDAGDLLAGLLGASSSGGSGDLGGLLSAVMGGGGADAGVGSLLAPVTDQLAEKLGIPPETAQMIVMFAVSKLLSGQARGGAAATRSESASQGDVDLDDLMAHMSSDRGLDADYLQSTGMVDELSQQTGLDSDTAAQGLQEAFEMLGGQLGGAQ